MRYPLVLLLFVVSATPTESQQHAPTMDVCRADVAVWFDYKSATEYANAEASRVTDGIPNRTEVAKLPFVEVNKRLTEMGDCDKVDKQHTDDYTQAIEFYNRIAGDRIRSFVFRHPSLFKQFIQEDAQGLR
jgi:hypothetical protein